MSTPQELKYTPEHEWLRIDGLTATVGITEFAAGKLGDIVFAELPTAGAATTAGKVIGELESTKSVAEVYAPVDGTITSVNDAVADDTSLINTDPYGDGWLFTVEFTELPELLDADTYDAQNGK